MNEKRNRLNDIKLFVMDVDGTLTDGKIYCSGDGELFKAFNVKDGYAIANILPEYGIIPVIITGRESDIVKYRATELKITELHQGVKDKLKALEAVMEKYGCTYENTAYIGDDINDIDCIKRCAVTASPSDAASKVKALVDYVCQSAGGNGAVREFIDKLVTENRHY